MFEVWKLRVKIATSHTSPRCQWEHHLSTRRVLLRSPAGNRRAGRAEFWSPTFQRAFPNLSERGSLVLDVGGESTSFAFMFNSSVTD